VFVDSAKINIKSGNGGNGMVSFHTEKYVPNGGPDGGDGGRGGDVIFYADDSIRTLRDFRYQRKYLAEDGENGKRRKCNGASGKTLKIALPIGTLIKDLESGQIIADLHEKGQQFIAARGGRGGKGNVHFANSVRQAPQFARAGESGEERHLEIELKLLADVGLVGFPNVGKSTLLSVISSAKPKIADYHFTTLEPCLGVVDYKGKQFVVADIPGLIEGAGSGAGLGHDFLKHIERTKMIIHVLDVSGSEGRDPISDYHKIRDELGTYNKNLLAYPEVIAANKTDLASDEQIHLFTKKIQSLGLLVYPISGIIGRGLDDLLDYIISTLDKLPPVVMHETTDIKTLYKLPDEELFEIEIIDGAYHVTGAWIKNIVESTNFNNLESVQYFQRILRKKGIIDALESHGIQQEDLVVMHTLEFEYMV
jgi:GTPase